MAQSSQNLAPKIDRDRERLQQRGHFWELLNLKRGTLFWAALKHPRHRYTYARPYIVVAQGRFACQDNFERCMLAVAGLETNSGFGSLVYPESNRTWIKNVTLSGPRQDKQRVNPARLMRSQAKDYDGDDTSPLYIDDQGNWEPRTNTIVDLSTLLVIEGYQALLCRPVAKLSFSSLERLDRIMDRLRGLSMVHYEQVMTSPTPRWSISQMPGYIKSVTKAQLRGDVVDPGVNATTISIFRPNDGIHSALNLDSILTREVPRGEKWQYQF